MSIVLNVKNIVPSDFKSYIPESLPFCPCFSDKLSGLLWTVCSENTNVELWVPFCKFVIFSTSTATVVAPLSRAYLENDKDTQKKKT